MALAANAMVDLQTMKDELDITDTSVDNKLTAYINRVSKLIEEYCERNFVMGFEAEYRGIVTTRPPRIYAKRFPVLGVQAITENAGGTATLVDPTEYIIENAFTGAIYRPNRWKRTSIRRPDIVQDDEPGTEESTLLLQYFGGYISYPQALGLGAWTGAASTPVGTLVLGSGATPNQQVWMATLAAGKITGTTGGVQPTWPTANLVQTKLGQQGLALGTSIVDNDITWVFMGLVGAAAGGAANEGSVVTMPQDLTLAAIETITAMWSNRGQDGNIKSEAIAGVASVTFGERGPFPPAAQATIDGYRRLGLAA